MCFFNQLAAYQLTLALSWTLLEESQDGASRESNSLCGFFHDHSESPKAELVWESSCTAHTHDWNSALTVTPTHAA